MISIIPLPVKYIPSEGKFSLSPDIQVYATNECSQFVSQINEWVKILFGYELQVITSEISKNVITLSLNPSLIALKEEGYKMDITPTKISIQGASSQGIFYGIQSLRQLLLASKQENPGEISALSLEDYPRFSWRGFMFDVGRHHHPIDSIKRILDIMAILKMNIFHWHFNEDQGWRIEINKYPKLTEIGSKRKDTQIGGFLSKKFRGQPHEGFYNQEEVQEIVRYAQERFIKVIPELEIPGHCSAAIASYPELCCTENQINVKTGSGIYPDIYCAGKERTFEFLQDVLDELMSLFPSEIFHIGGDEAPKKRWKECNACQERIRSEGLKDEDELQVYFTNRIADYLKTKGKRIMGWNQILGESLDPSAIVHWWRGKKNKKYKYLRNGRNFIMSNFGYTYLDYNYLMFPLRKFYNYNPIPKKLESQHHQNVLGLEAPIWTEWVPNLERLGWQVFPRLIALAEVGWTQKTRKNYSNFKMRLPNLLKYLNLLDMPYAKLEEVDPSNFKRFTHLHQWFKWPEI